MREWHILNLGAGWQSTALYVLSTRGEESEFVPKFDFAIFADTQDEPQAVYKHLEFLKTLGGPEIVVVTKGSLGNDLTNGVNSTGQRFASIPAYTRAPGDKIEGQTRRQCTKEYKTDVMDLWIKRNVLGVKPRCSVPDDVLVHRYLGLSYDEPKRVARVKGRYAGNVNPTGLMPIFDDGPPRSERKGTSWATPHFPLFEMEWSRADCGAYLKELGISAPRSACVFCPYHSNEEWRAIRAVPEDWARACEIDRRMREHDAICNKGLEKRLYVHRSCVPLDQADIDEKENAMELYRLGSAECEGGCFL